MATIANPNNEEMAVESLQLRVQYATIDNNTQPVGKNKCVKVLTVFRLEIPTISIARVYPAMVRPALKNPTATFSRKKEEKFGANPDSRFTREELVCVMMKTLLRPTLSARRPDTAAPNNIPTKIPL